MSLRPFHLAFPVDDLNAARQFYREVLGCSEGRSSDQWIDLDFFGHQIVAHLVQKMPGDRGANPVDGHGVPVPHFGVVLTMKDWQDFANKLRASDIEFVIEPHIRFAGQPGEQATMFFRDPCGNAIEIKAFASDDRIFRR